MVQEIRSWQAASEQCIAAADELGLSRSGSGQGVPPAPATRPSSGVPSVGEQIHSVELFAEPTEAFEVVEAQGMPGSLMPVVEQDVVVLVRLT